MDVEIMMLYPAMNKLTQYVPNRYMLVNVVARRARQIAEEAEEYGYESVEEYTKNMDKEAYREYLLMNETLAFLGENVKVTAEGAK